MVALMMVVTGLTPASAIAPAAIQPRSPAKTACPDEMPGEASVRLAVRLCGKRIKVADLTTETAEYFVNLDGSTTVEQRVRPVRINRDGQWLAADTTLAARPDGTLAPRAAATEMSFSGGGAGPLVKASVDGTGIEIGSPVGALPAPHLEGSSAVYPEVLPGVDLVVTADVDGFAEKLVVKNREAATNPALARVRFPVMSEKGTLTADKDGNNAILNAKGEPVFVASAAEMWDGADERARTRSPGAKAGVQAGAGRHRLMKTRINGGALEVTPDRDVLADPATEFPVVIDPGFTSTRSAWTYVDSGYPTTTYYNSTTEATVGTYNGGTNKKRSFFNMGLSGLAGKKVTAATFNIREVWAWSCTARNVTLYRSAAAISSGTNWNNQPGTNLGLGSKNVAYGWSSAGQGGASSCPAAWVGWDVTGAVQEAVNGGATTLPLTLRAASETDDTYWKRFENNPNISITYNTVPGTPTAQAVAPCVSVCASPAVTGALRPTLSAKVSDAEGSALRADFEVWTADRATKVTGGSVTSVPSGGTASWTLPSNLADGTRYSWKVRSFDGLDYSAWTGWSDFTVDVTAPAAPSIASDDYPAGEWAKGANQAGRFTITPASADVSTLLWSVDGGTQQSVANSGSPYTLTYTPTSDGPHTLRASARDKAGNVSATTTYVFYAGSSAVTSPTEGQSTARRVVLAASGSGGLTGVTFAYRRGSADTWHQVPAADVRRKADGSAVTWPVAMSSAGSPELVWDVTHSLTTDGTIEIRAEFVTAQGTASSPAVSLIVDRNAQGAATQPIGPGVLNLLTGDFRFSATDANAFGVGVMRSFGSRASRTGADGTVPIFGSAWNSGGLAQTLQTSYSRLHATSATSVDLVGIDDSSLGFTKNANGTWSTPPNASGLTLTYSASTDRYTLTDQISGDQTVFAKVDPAATDYLVRSIVPPVAKGGTVFVYDRVTGTGGEILARPAKIIAPTTAVASQNDCDVATFTALPAGCRVLVFGYASATTATDGRLGDFTGQVRQISLWEGGTAAPSVLADYRYSATGQLREVIDPGVAPGAVTAYEYDAAGRVVKLTQPGQLPWTFTYGRAGNPDTAADGMLVAVSRPTLTPGSKTQTNGTAVASVVYDVPVSGTGAPYAMGVANVAAWNQLDAPQDATAIFPADQVPTSVTGRGALGSGDYRRAGVYYLNANGKLLNRAEPGGHIAASSYDSHGNVVGQLTAANRALALGQGENATEQLTQLGLIGASTAERARQLSTESIYSADGDRKVAEYGPLHVVTLEKVLAAEGNQPQLAAGTRVAARAHRVSVYDEGRPTDGSANVSGLITTERTGAALAGRTVDGDVRTVKTTYDWAKGLATKVVKDPGGLAITTVTAYDAEGRVIESRMPKSAGNDAGTTVREYYTADGTGTCGGRPAWAGQLCRTSPKAAVTGGGSNPSGLVTKVYTYTDGGRISKVTETANGVTRTTSTEYDGEGRVTGTKVTGGLGADVPEVTAQYDIAGNPVRTTAANGTVIIREYDALGRQVAYTDADGGVTRVDYDSLDRVIKRTDSAPSTTTYTYDLNTEPRGLVTTMTDSVAGAFQARYDPDGAISGEVLPGGVTYGVIRNEVGSPSWRGYQAPSGVWLANNSVEWSIHAQQTQSAAVSTQKYRYDGIGRLSTVEDTEGPVCTGRTYGYDGNSNRTSVSTVVSVPGRPCPLTGATTVTHSHDSADRLVDPGYAYDAFGRVSATPGGEAMDYYTTDLVKSLRSGDSRQSWSLDPQLRRRAMTAERLVSGAWKPAGSKVDHFNADDDTPAWTVEDTATGAITRDVRSISGGLAATTSATGEVRLQLTNLHDDVNVVYDLATGIPAVLDYDEFGNPRSGQPRVRYGWHGAAQRAADTPDGSLLMGSRLYQPKLGRFLQVDPVEGGSANAYDYAAQAPTSNADLDGNKWYSCRNFWHFAFNHCGVDYAWYHGSWRAVKWVHTPGGWWVRGVYYDYCTSSPDKPLGYDFRSACMMHDYGYALVKRGYVSSKHEVDYVFYYVLYWGVCNHYFWKGTCRGIAYKYYLAVYYFGRV
ncbi:phospholipase A2 [Streptosporangium sp. NPDC087985]|uniref:phospholipase A2 n=1 Tax=Streptosporangium sp. NPDC087985 TaxID=3366196 RepID=UPI003815828F